jgi:predicted nucleotidyltransferase
MDAALGLHVLHSTPPYPILPPQVQDRTAMMWIPLMSKPANLQQHEARALATHCAHVLQHRFGARRVIPFGSVVGHGTWHPGSDLDLAVEGIAPEQFFQAWATVRALVPPGMEVDLVDLEHASEALRARILGEKTMAEEPMRALKALIEDELAALGQLVQAMQEGLDPGEATPSQFAMQALASYVHQFYTGCERILERIAVAVDGGLPGGAFSHANLLAQMAQERPGVRPAVLPEALWLRLQDYLAFRHFFRHAYGYTLEWAKLRPLVGGMYALFIDLQGQLISFLDTLCRDS